MDVSALASLARPVAQPVAWPAAELALVTHALARRPGLVSAASIERLRGALASSLPVLQAGPCAESFHDDPRDVDALVALLRSLGSGMTVIARLAGQYAKPRSKPVEVVDGVEIPSFRGHAVHGEAPDARRPDPRRLLEMYRRSAATLLRCGLFVSHEALLLDYESALVRRFDDAWYATSAHTLWVGDRTRSLEGAHIGFLAEIANPVAVKLGPTATPDEVYELSRLLNPERIPGRLTFITRLGVEHLDRLPALREAGVAARWLCDPMHGNTHTDAWGLKFRRPSDILTEASASCADGLHLEVTAEDVDECVETPVAGRRYTSLCDPRLNAAQARRVVAAVPVPGIVA
jgi:3-deoxy-7-phosphoheptulonate synthase